MKMARARGMTAAQWMAAAALLAAAFAGAQTTPAAAQEEPHRGRVIFSRSTDENGQTTTTEGPAANEKTAKSTAAPSASDAEREAVRFTNFDMDVHLRPAAQQMAVRALVTVRNGGKVPLNHIPMQISSTLTWERIRAGGRDAEFTLATLNSDEDHTGQLHEATVTLAEPLAPGATVTLDAAYSGTIQKNAQRLIAIGTPDDVALHSDWDGIGEEFTGLRGYGNVAWYPAAGVPAILGDGARVFDEMGTHKLRMAGAGFRMSLAIEFPHGHEPTVALINGRPMPLRITEPETAGEEIAGVATARLDSSTLGFEAPSLFVTTRKPQQAANTTIYAQAGHEDAVQNWSAAIDKVTPFLQNWLGQAPRTQLTILEPPEAEDASFETGSLLVTAVRKASSDQLTGILAHALTHAWMSSPRAWLSEGVAHFMGTLWLERQDGRQKALESLESGRTALALVEPASPGASTGEPLAQATVPVYYRTKATYVLWMLRDLVGDPALSAALRAYDPAGDAASGLGPESGPGTFEKLVEQAGSRSDLAWFFNDWVNADKGLPDIAIENAYPAIADSPAERAQTATANASSSRTANNAATENPLARSDFHGWLVSVDLSNSGYVAAEIPVTARNADTAVTQRIVVPARGRATLRILISGKPAEVQANDGTIPETEASVHVRKLVSGTTNPATPLPH